MIHNYLAFPGASLFFGTVSNCSHPNSARLNCSANPTGLERKPFNKVVDTYVETVEEFKAAGPVSNDFVDHRVLSILHLCQHLVWFFAKERLKNTNDVLTLKNY